MIETVLGQLPEQFTYGPLTRQMDAYVNQRWKRGPHGWYKRSRSIEYNKAWTPEGTRDSWRWVEYPSVGGFGVNGGLRLVGKVHEIRGSGDGNLPYFDYALVDHTGWFCDPYHDGETVHGVVFQMPARNGESVYIPAISDQCGNDGNVMDFHRTTSDLKDAIRYADRMAESYAEREREYQAKELATMKIEELAEEIRTERADLLTLVRELRANCDKLTGMNALRATIREHIAGVRATCKRLEREKAKIEDEGLCFY